MGALYLCVGAEWGRGGGGSLALRFLPVTRLAQIRERYELKDKRRYYTTWRFWVQITTKTRTNMKAYCTRQEPVWPFLSTDCFTEGLCFLRTDWASDTTLLNRSLLYGNIYNLNGSEYTRNHSNVLISSCQNLTVYAYVRVSSLAKPPVSFMNVVVESSRLILHFLRLNNK